MKIGEPPRFHADVCSSINDPRDLGSVTIDDSIALVVEMRHDPEVGAAAVPEPADAADGHALQPPAPAGAEIDIEGAPKAHVLSRRDEADEGHQRALCSFHSS
jgi:hypothetical protein